MELDFHAYIKNYNDLRNINPDDDPLLLIIILVPEKVEDWLQQSETELCSRALCLLDVVAGSTRKQQPNYCYCLHSPYKRFYRGCIKNPYAANS
jgi:hypothetical protein